MQYQWSWELELVNAAGERLRGFAGVGGSVPWLSAADPDLRPLLPTPRSQRVNNSIKLPLLCQILPNGTTGPEKITPFSRFSKSTKLLQVFAFAQMDDFRSFGIVFYSGPHLSG
jgi:hypothetical protein